MAISDRAAGRHRARITSQGQITVPKAVRDRLGAKPGDELEFEPGPDSFVIRVHPRRSVLAFAGIGRAAAHRIPATAEGIDQLLAKGRGGRASARDRALRRRAEHERGRQP